MEKQRNINDLSVIELKAVLFDLDQEVKIKQSQYSQVGRILQSKLEQEEKGVKEDGVKKGKDSK